MSHQQPPDDQPSEEEMREYVAQLRGAPVEQIVVELVQGLLNAAQMKLGRNDGRLLIDTTAVLMANIGPHVAEDLAVQVNEAVTQLRLAQVEAEKEVAASGQPEPNDLQARPASAAGSPPPPPAAPGSKLWVPGG